MPESLNIVLFVCGAGLMAIALARAWVFAPSIQPGSSRRIWLGLTAFIAVFFTGYLAAVMLTLSGRYEILAGLTSVVFFAGAFFVLLTIYLTTHLTSVLTFATQRQEALINELEVKNSTLESFSYATSHDLKSPLVTIRSFLGLVRSDAESGDLGAVIHDIGRIEKAAERMQRAMDGLLELGIAGRIMHEPASVRLEDAIAEAMNHATDPSQNGDLVLELEPEMPEVLADYERLVTVFQNLLDNAAKFMGAQPEPRVKIAARRTDSGMVECIVSDNGMGIDSPSPEQVFQIFTRLETEVDGHGVGLALVKRIVEAHGGTIRVASEGSNRGSTFTFTLPAA